MAFEAALPTTPAAELLVVDRPGWIAGNVRTFSRLLEGTELSRAEAKVLAVEGGAFLGLLARAVLAQYDPFRDVVVVVYPNLGPFASGDGLRWLLFHEVTHLAQFRSAPWLADEITDVARSVLSVEGRGWAEEFAQRLRAALPEVMDWLRGAIEGKPREGISPLIDLLPEPQRSSVLRLHAMVTVLEGHATYVTDLIGRRVLDDPDRVERHMRERRQRPPLVRLLEALAGIDMKRQQYVIGRTFCQAVWDAGGAEALAPVWRSADGMPSIDEVRDPQRWLARVAA